MHLKRAAEFMPGPSSIAQSATRQRLRLESMRCWIVITEAHEFVWPGRTRVLCLGETRFSGASPEIGDYIGSRIPARTDRRGA